MKEVQVRNSSTDMVRDQIKITVPDVSKRNWKSLEEVKKIFTDEEITTIVHRYCDTQDHAKVYRVKRAARIKAVMAMAKEQGLLDDLDE